MDEADDVLVLGVFVSLASGPETAWLSLLVFLDGEDGDKGFLKPVSDCSSGEDVGTEAL